MRALVRTLGSLLIAFGAFLWLYAATVAHLNHGYSPVAVVPAVKPAPPPSKSRHHNEAPTSKAPTPVPVPATEAPKHPPVSKTVLTYVNPVQHKFTVDLHKEDGWFDTGIPVTADISVLEFCLSETNAHNGQWVQAMVGGTVFRPLDMGNEDLIVSIDTFPSGQNPGQKLFPAQQFLQVPAQTVQTLKLRIAGDNAPDEIRQAARTERKEDHKDNELTLREKGLGHDLELSDLRHELEKEKLQEQIDEARHRREAIGKEPPAPPPAPIPVPGPTAAERRETQKAELRAREKTVREQIEQTKHDASLDEELRQRKLNGLLGKLTEIQDALIALL